MTAVARPGLRGAPVTFGSGPRRQEVEDLQVRTGNQAVTRLLLARMIVRRGGDRDQRDGERWLSAPLSQTVSAGPASGAAADAGLDSIDSVRAKVERLIEASRKLGYVQAAAHLEHWYRGHGERLMVPEEVFTREAFWVRHVRDAHGARFAQGAQRRAGSGVLAPGGTAEMTWRDTVVAPANNELFFALGGFTVSSSVTVTAQEIPEDPTSLLVTVTRWTVRCSDYYNFDPGKTAFVPGFGRIEDAEMDRLRQAGLARDFPVESAPIDALRVLGAFEISVPRK
ncbi:hypothetical protein ADK86_03220 [Streptomyces sp. NRRL F-5755]|uniref:hypothetical protein n=1 Tax=Streptomyces sp. NRRL F-5755 TaxID=1519475 RepID=UPI0006B012DA|nr:hypothetical protein [Streptomyces sp. NRRL F-5755]KOU08786.1 hypothetical protein ADK86_03220 [Streptomyces sp. NRRL F-5755]